MKRRFFLLVSLLVIALLGLATKFHNGPWQGWVRDYAGAIFYEIFWILLALALWPRLSALRVATGVFVVTSFLEILQLWHPPFLEMLRGTFLGAALLGTTFDWWDFPHYVIGCAIGIVLAKLLDRWV